MSTKQARSASFPKVKVAGHGPWVARVTVDRIVHVTAGTLILLSLALARYHSAHWLWFTIFVGANLFQSGLTNWCLATTILRKLGVPEGKAVGCSP